MRVKSGLVGLVLAALTLLSMVAGCDGVVRRPYDVPQYEEIAVNETAFVVPLEGDTTKQKQWQTTSFLRDHQVSAKRIQVPHTWVRLGRNSNHGKYVPAIAVIKLSLSPEQREWTEAKDTGTSAQNQGIKAETAESNGFMARMNCSCQVDEQAAATFAHYYFNRQLASVVDSDVRATVESTFAAECAQYPLEKLLANKGAIMDRVRAATKKFCASRGITLNQLGYKGEFTWDSEAVQQQLDKRFQARQERLAQDDINRRLIAEARAKAEAARLMATTHNSGYLKHEERMAFLEKWDGRLPLTGGSGATMLSVPSEYLAGIAQQTAAQPATQEAAPAQPEQQEQPQEEQTSQ